MNPTIQTMGIYISPGLGVFVTQTIQQTIHNPTTTLIALNSIVVVG